MTTRKKTALYQKTLVSAITAFTLALGSGTTLAANTSMPDTIVNPTPDNTKLHRSDEIYKLQTDNPNLTKPKVGSLVKNNQPNRIVTTIKGDPSTSMAFHWFTSDATNDPVVLVSSNADMSSAQTFAAKINKVDSHYLQRDQDGYFIYKIARGEPDKEEVLGYFTDKGRTDLTWEPINERKIKDEFIGIATNTTVEHTYSAEASKLKPNTVYYYQVGSKDGELSKTGTFRTASEPKSNAAFSFIHYTDTQNAFWNEHKRNEAAFSADTLYQAQKMAPDANFVLHTGDIVEVAEVEDEWVDLMKQSQDGLLKMSLVAVPGNHDEYGLSEEALYPNKFIEHFNVDSAGKNDGGTYYSFDYNNAHFIVLNTNDYKNPELKALGKEQLQWLRDDVKKARDNGATWVILAYHKPLFSKTYHSLQDKDVQNVRDDFMKAIDDLDIDVALQGHDHVFSRTKSLVYAPKAESFVNAKIDYADFDFDANGYKTLKAPKGTTFIIPNTGGTKAYDAIFNTSLEHIKKVRTKLDWLTQAQLEHYNSLFEIGYQPSRSARFKNSHENYRDSSEQNFAVYSIENKTFTGSVYQISGDLAKGEARRVRLVDHFAIQK